MDGLLDARRSADRLWFEEPAPDPHPVQRVRTYESRSLHPGRGLFALALGEQVHPLVDGIEPEVRSMPTRRAV